MVTAKFSKNKRAIEERIRRLPELMIGQMKARAKRDANGVIENFRTGIEQDLFHLARLKPNTVKSKTSKGMDNPSVPLAGLGFDDLNSYLNCLESVEEGERRYVVRPKNEWHHGKDSIDSPRQQKIRLKDLFDVHEYGAVIKNAFGKGITVRIPPRPALRYAYRAYMAERRRRDPSLKVKLAICLYVFKGRRAALDRIASKLEAGEEP